jgi:hypothetical protein
MKKFYNDIPMLVYLGVCFVIGLIILASGCASTLTNEERLWRESVDNENWELCQLVYRKHGQPTFSTHAHGVGKGHRPEDVRDDLRSNNCRMTLRSYWIEY